MSMKANKSIVNILEKYCIYFENEIYNTLYKYINLLIKCPINLTSIKDYDSAIENHIVDTILPIYNTSLISNSKKCVDIGSGGGIPGIIWGIIYPNVEFHLVESIHKKTVFLEEFINKLELKNIFIYNERAEEFSQKNKEKFDIATSRAVARIDIVAEYLLPLIKINGKALIFKGPNYLREEKKYLEKVSSILRYEIGEEKGYFFYDNDEKKSRTMIIVEKKEKTPSSYPREIGIPKKLPLGGL